MKGSQTLSAIFSQVWFIHPGYAHGQLEVLSALLEGKITTLQQGQADQPAPPIFASPDNTGMLYITGPVFKYDGACGEPGYLSYGQQLIDFQMDDSIKVIVMVIDSPGGQGAGLRTFAQQVKNSTKPVIAYINDGMCASAGYWIASQARWIICAQPTDRIGSIGAYMLILNYLKASENAGKPLIEVYSSLSTEKNLSVREALAGNQALLINEIDHQVKYYIQDVKDGRGDRLDLTVADPFKGGDYPAISDDGIDALSIGLIDEVGTIDLVFERATEFINNPNIFNMSIKNTKLSGLVGMTVAQVSQTSLDAINAELTEAGITNFGVYPESLVNDAEETTTQLTAANDKIAKLESAATDAGTKFTELEKTANASAAQVTELTGKLENTQKELTAANEKIEKFESGNPASGNNGNKAKSEGDKTLSQERELYSWEKKKQALRG